MHQYSSSLKKFICIDYQYIMQQSMKFAQTNHAVWDGLGRWEEWRDKQKIKAIVSKFFLILANSTTCEDISSAKHQWFFSGIQNIRHIKNSDVG